MLQLGNVIDPVLSHVPIIYLIVYDHSIDPSSFLSCAF